MAVGFRKAAAAGKAGACGTDDAPAVQAIDYVADARGADLPDRVPPGRWSGPGLHNCAMSKRKG